MVFCGSFFTGWYFLSRDKRFCNGLFFWTGFLLGINAVISLLRSVLSGACDIHSLCFFVKM